MNPNHVGGPAEAMEQASRDHGSTSGNLFDLFGNSQTDWNRASV
jgi:hypothetical protein